MNLPKQVESVEVSPRDGLQMLPAFVPTADKIKLIESLKQAGFRRIEAVSFVNPMAVPQMADAHEIMAAIGNDPDALGVKVAQAAIALKRNRTGALGNLVVSLSKDESPRPEVII